MAPLNRRSFITGSLAAGCLPGALGQRVRGADRTDVIVIGAGLAGLHAASLLERQGARVTVLEGSSRLGGRVHSADAVRLRPEYGASEIGRSYARILSTAHTLGLSLDAEDRELLPFAAHLNGHWIKAADWPSSDQNPLPDTLRTTPAARVGPALLAQLNPLKTFEDWLDPRFAGLDVSVNALFARKGFSRELIDLASRSTPSMSAVSALALMQEATRGVIDRTFTSGNLAASSNVRGGASRLIEAMAASLAGPLMQRKVVAGIDMTGSHARVTCLDGSVFTADFVIAALPFTQLRRIDVRPNFEGVQLDAVQTMPTLGTTRAYLAIHEPFWHADGLDPSFFSDGAIEMFWAIDNHKGSGEFHGTMVLTGDRAARLDALLATDVPRFLLQELSRLRPASKGKVEILTWNSWGETPLIGCCRHMYAPGQITRCARDMIKPWQRLHLAGEHTRRNDFGMEAAMESGERVALEILSASA